MEYHVIHLVVFESPHLTRLTFFNQMCHLFNEAVALCEYRSTNLTATECVKIIKIHGDSNLITF